MGSPICTMLDKSYSHPKAVAGEPRGASVAGEVQRPSAGRVPSCSKEVSLWFPSAIHWLDKTHPHYGGQPALFRVLSTHFPDSWTHNSYFSQIPPSFFSARALWSLKDTVLLNEEHLPEMLAHYVPMTLCPSLSSAPPASAGLGTQQTFMPILRPSVPHYMQSLPPQCLALSEDIRMSTNKNIHKQQIAKIECTIFLTITHFKDSWVPFLLYMVSRSLLPRKLNNGIPLGCFPPSPPPLLAKSGKPLMQRFSGIFLKQMVEQMEICSPAATDQLTGKRDWGQREKCFSKLENMQRSVCAD